MNISMILIGGGVLVGALAFLPKGEKEREQVDYEYVEGMEEAPGFDPETGWFFEFDVAPGPDTPVPMPEIGGLDTAIPFPVDTGIPMGEPERRLTTTGEVEVIVVVR